VLAAPLPLLPLVASPSLGLAVGLVAIAAFLAARSVAYPVALAALPSVVVGLNGSNPFPKGAIFLFMSAWLLMAVGFILLKEGLAAFAGAGRWALFVTIGLALVALIRVAPGAYPALKLKFFIAQNLPLLLAGILIARRRRDFNLFVVLSVVAAAVSALVLLKQFAQGNAQAFYPERFALSAEDNPIGFGRVASDGILFAVFIVLTVTDRRLRLLGMVVLPLVTIALVASGSRGPVLALCAGLVAALLFLLRDPTARRRLVLVLAALSAGAIAIPKLLPAATIQRSVSFLLGNGTGLSSNGRTHLWTEAWQAFTTHPLFGVGTGGFAQIEPSFKYPHNLVLEVSAELGVVGLVLLLAFVVPTAAPLIRAWHGAIGVDRAAAALIAALLTSSLVNSLLSDSLEGSSAVWFAAGLAYGLASRPTLVGEADGVSPRSVELRRPVASARA